jgi:CBS domain-containing protein
MSREVHYCRATDGCEQAARVMWDHDCGALPVVDEKGALAGMITDRDICMAAYTQGKPLAQIPVAAVSAHKVHTVRPEDSIEFAEELMKRYRVRRLVVLDRGGNLAGVLSLADIVRASCSRGQPGDALDREGVASALANIFRPHCGCARGP